MARDLTGMGYDRPEPTYDKLLVETAKGTPMGEYMRRYWHPVAISADVGETPMRRRILGEDLILFRDGNGRAGAVYEFCAHRGASLFYGRVDPEGIRCCYHGWQFDVEGRCLNQPIETGGGKCAAIRQPWYPVEELYGLVFVYMGPPDQIPLIPRYKSMENLAENEQYVHAIDSLPGATSEILPTNWLIDMDNIHDLGHAPWLHHLHSGPQFGEVFDFLDMDTVPAWQNSMKYVETDEGIYSIFDQPMFDGTWVRTSLETQMPNIRIICPPMKLGEAYLINWVVPIDDDSHYAISLSRIMPGDINMTVSPMHYWDRSDPLMVQKMPSDNEAQNTQGPIPRHSEEHLVLSDRGVGKMRRQYHRQLKALEARERLMNIRFEGEDPYIKTWSGAWEIEAPTTPPAKVLFEAFNDV